LGLIDGVNKIENNSALSFAESVEGVSHDFFTRSLHKSGHWLRVLVNFVARSTLARGYLVLDIQNVQATDKAKTTIQKFTSSMSEPRKYTANNLDTSKFVSRLFATRLMLLLNL
jgi:hypothetical protein